MNIEAYYQNIRDSQQRALKARKERAYRACPELARNEQRILYLKMKTALGENPGERDELLGLIKIQKESLRLAGLPENALSLWYNCGKCKDTGLLKDGSYCPCYNKARLKLSGIDPISFDDWDASRIPQEDNQRAKSLKLLELCRDYTRAYPENPQRNLMLMGTTGVGKTFALTCIGFELAQRGINVKMLTSSDFLRVILDKVIGERDVASLVRLENVPVLILDDLGSGASANGIVEDYVYSLMDKRLNLKKHTLISTNLNTDEIIQRYGHRLYSRITDPSTTAVIKITGRDLRLN